MRAGKLRHRVVIQKPAGSGDALTQQPLDYEDVAERPAQVRPVSVKEIFAAAGYLGHNDVVVTVRYEPAFDDLNHTWRIVFQNHYLYVVGVLNPEMRDRWLNISAAREQGDLRLKNYDFDQPLHEVVNVVMPELT